MMTRQILLVSALMTAFSSVAAPAGEGRVVRGLVDWTVDGVAVKVPHTWNVKDGCDGPGKASSHVEDDWLWGHNSVKGVGYARKAVWQSSLTLLAPENASLSLRIRRLVDAGGGLAVITLLNFRDRTSAKVRSRDAVRLRSLDTWRTFDIPAGGTATVPMAAHSAEFFRVEEWTRPAEHEGTAPAKPF